MDEEGRSPLISAERFTALINEYGPKMKSIARSYLGHTADVDDLLAEVWMKLYEKRYLLTNVTNPSAWLGKVVRNQCLNLLKKQKRFKQRFVLTGFPGRFDAIASFVNEDSSRLFQARETRLWVNRLLETQKEAYRIPLRLFYFEDLSVREISEILGISESTIKWRLHHGRQLLRKTAIRMLGARKVL